MCIRQQWIADGMQWSGKGKKAPKGWNPQTQLGALALPRHAQAASKAARRAVDAGVTFRADGTDFKPRL
jgi:hypothetical protein